MRKNLIIAMALTLLACTACQNKAADLSATFTELSYEQQPSWCYLGSADYMEGADAWSYLYTEETNTNGVYDINKFQEGDSPAESSLTPTDSRSAILAFTAPADGNYYLEASFGAEAEENTSDFDGVTFSIYGNDTLLYTHNYTDLIENGTVYRNAMLKKGESCYFIVDPNNSSDGDHFSGPNVYVFQTLDTYVDNQTTWAWGASYQNGDGTQQGVNNWYYLYTEETGTFGIYDSESIKPCIYRSFGENYMGTGAPSGEWIPSLYKDLDDKSIQDSLWRFNSNGAISPSCNNVPSASAVIAFEAPTLGDYSIEIASANTSSAGNHVDGLTLSFYVDNQKIESLTFGSYEQLGNYCIEVSMKEGQHFYCIVDPNDNNSYFSVYDIDILVKKQ